MFTVGEILDMISGKKRMYRGGACFGTQDVSRLRPAWNTPVPRDSQQSEESEETVRIDTEEFLKNMSK